jgi:hypothetical protein
MWVSSAQAGLLYSTLPGDVTIDPVVSWGYQAQLTSEFGDLITTDASGPGTLNSAQILLSNWSYETAYQTLGTSGGYTVPVTLTLYNVGAGDSVGASIVSSTANVFVPWRAEPDLSCADSGLSGNPTLVNGICSSGAPLVASFSFDNVSLTPGSSLIYGVSFNTQNAGYSPLGVSGTYNGLNFGWSTDAPLVGANPQPDTGYLNTTNASTYFDAGAGGVGTFRQDQNYTIYSDCGGEACAVGAFSGAIALSSDIVATPEPGTVALLLIGVAGLGRVRFLKRRG